MSFRFFGLSGPIFPFVVVPLNGSDDIFDSFIDVVLFVVDGNASITRFTFDNINPGPVTTGAANEGTVGLSGDGRVLETRENDFEYSIPVMACTAFFSMVQSLRCWSFPHDTSWYWLSSLCDSLRHWKSVIISECPSNFSTGLLNSLMFQRNKLFSLRRNWETSTVTKPFPKGVYRAFQTGA